MKVELNDSTVYVEWKYSNPAIPHPHSDEFLDPKQPLITTCKIVKRKQNTREEAEIMAEASIRRYHKDVFNKEEARKKSLSAVLELLYPKMEVPVAGIAEIINQELQLSIQAAYKHNKAMSAARRPFWHTFLHRKPTLEQKIMIRLLPIVRAQLMTEIRGEVIDEMYNVGE